MIDFRYLDIYYQFTGHNKSNFLKKINTSEIKECPNNLNKMWQLTFLRSLLSKFHSIFF